MNLVMLLVGFAGQTTGSVAFAALPVERVVRIAVPDHDAVYSLQHRVRLTIVDAGKDYVTAYADDRKIAELRALGYPVTVLLDDYRRQIDAPLGTYATYAEVCSTMRYLATAYSAITKLETLGISVQGRPILIMKVTGNPNQEANKARIRLNGPHHGNEKIATEITLALLKYLCEDYAADPGIRALVDSREIWIDPIFNVDGHAYSTAGRRTNANGVDLNRDYGYEWAGGMDTTPGPFSQVETKAMRNHSERHIPTLEFSYHSAAAYVNYLWDNHPADPPDSGWVIQLSSRYADSTYGANTQLDPINGYDWYEVHGSCQDATFGIYGGLAWTIETDLPSSRTIVDQICLANRRALLDMIKLGGWGMQGLVYDSLTQTPLFARVEFTAPSRWTTYTQSQVGDFHKMLAPGTYTVKVIANGYVSKIISNVVVPDTGAVSIDVPLVQPGTQPLDYVQKVVWLRRIDDSHAYHDWVIRALGAPDGVSYSMGLSGYANTIVFDVDPFQPIRNQPGNDVTVYASGLYSLSAANNWEGPWFALGSGSGQANFDLSSVGLDSARYLKIVSTGTTTLDAISYVGSPLVGASAPRIEQAVTSFAVEPNPASHRVVINLGSALDIVAAVSVTDVTGRTVRRLLQSTRLPRNSRITWDLRNDGGRLVPSGVYFCRVESAGGTLLRKVVVER
jgi:hypothetical protein